MADDQSDSKFSRRDFLEVSSGALAGAGVPRWAIRFIRQVLGCIRGHLAGQNGKSQANIKCCNGRISRGR